VKSIYQQPAHWAFGESISLNGISANAVMPKRPNFTGAMRVPPASTCQIGSRSIAVDENGLISGTISTTGVLSTSAYIHKGVAGANGPVIIALIKASESVWAVPAGSKLNAEQVRAYRVGGLYISVHSLADKGVEIRAQLAPRTARPPLTRESSALAGFDRAASATRLRA